MRTKPILPWQFTSSLIRSFLSMFNSSISKRKISSKECSQNRPSKNSNWIGSNQFPNKCHTGIFQYGNNVLSHQIKIFLSHFGYLVFNFASVMFYDKCILFSLWFLVKWILLLNTVEFLKESFICCSGETGEGGNN